MARWVGAKVHGDRLRRLRGHQLRNDVADAVEDGVEIIAVIAKGLITEGAVSGPEHVPSAPGEPPNADTHELDQSIHTVVDRNNLYGKVVADAPYAADQEFGNSQLPERPYMRPAAKIGRPKARQGVVEAVQHANKGSGR